MKKELDVLKASVSHFVPPPKISDEQWQEFADNTVVALMAGGESSRFTAVAGNTINKNAFELPNGDTMIEMTIRMYAEAGIKRFVALVYHNAHTIEDKLGDGSDLGVKITYSHDPQQPVGKGGAVRNALENGSIPKDANLIVHNPDDVVMNFEGSFPRYLAAGQVQAQEQKRVATVVVVPETAYAFTGMKITNNSVEEIEMYPMVPIPAHIGVTVFSPEVYNDFEQLFDLDKKTDFEKVLFPHLADKKQLHAISLNSGQWIAVNDTKAYKQLISLL